MPEFKECYLPSSVPKMKIHTVMCIPDGDVKATFQICHGVAEHIGRYRGFMEFMAGKGFACIGNDHLGHGDNIDANPGSIGQFCKDDGWDHVVRDAVSVHDHIAGLYPGLKHVLFGHSMGSFVARTYISDYPDRFGVAVISGTGQQSGLLVAGGRFLSRRAVKSKGYDSDGSSLNKLMFGSYLNRIENPRTPSDWLSRDAGQVDLYEADEKCGFVCRAGLYADMMTGISYVRTSAAVEKVPSDKPVLFISGDQDPVGDYGKGVRKIYGMFVNAGKKADIKLYPGGRHEMLNEINRDEVYDFIYNWVNSKI